MSAPYGFLFGDICDESALGLVWFLLVFGVFSRYPAFGFLSVSSQSVLNESVLWFSVWGHFVMNRPLGFCVFFLVVGVFSRYPAVGFLSSSSQVV